MAEYMLKHEAKQRELSARVVSMGTLGIVGRQAAREAIAVMDEWDIDLRPHRSQGVSLAVLGACSHIFVMEPEHQEFITRMAPRLKPKLHLMGMWDPELRSERVDDPVNLDIEVFRTCRDRLHRSIEHFLKMSSIT
jgi:protein-tyrosine phosphatase